MSREERRAYERMNKGRDPFAPPVSPQARQRMERQKQRRATRRGSAAAGSGGRSRFGLWAVGGAAATGLVAFSLAWPQGMPNALYIGLAVALVWVVLALGARWMARRRAASGSPPPR
jgi:Flp pilus assembly protein TadB